MKTIFTTKSIRLAAFVGLCFICINANAGKLYKWVDAQGNVSYQDQPPPKGSKILSEKEVASKKGAGDNQGNKALKELKIYTVKDCDLCEAFISFMRKNNVPHIELSLQDDRDAQKLILDKIGSLRAPSLLIGTNVYQHATINEFSTALSKAGYSIAEAAPEKASASDSDSENSDVDEESAS